MKGWPALDDMDAMLTIVPSTLSRRISFAASCIRKKGARTLMANIRSKSSGEVSRIVPRSVMAAALTRASSRPKAASAAATTSRQSSTRARSARRKRTLQPVSAVIASATALPFSALRPQVTRPAAPRSASSLAMAAPRPWVPPVTTAIFPSNPLMAYSTIW